VTGTATSRRTALGIAAVALLLAGCGGHGPARSSTAAGPSTASSTAGPSTASSAATNRSARPSGATSSFAWLRTAAPPAGWTTTRIPSGAAFSYPPGWTRIKGDPGTATAALFGPNHQFVGYLNLTPRQGEETLANWGRFRIEHNGEEGDRDVRRLAVAIQRRLRGATASCVKDQYTTADGARYVEIACLFSGRRTSVVAVGASPPDDWARVAPSLERAITSVNA
jgi:hypothetical protein